MKDQGSRRDRDDEESASGVRVNPNIATYLNEQGRITASADPSSWLSRPEIPDLTEIVPVDPNNISLPRNRISKPWKSEQSYLEAHFRLLREDTNSGLRESIALYRQDSQRHDDESTKIYDKVHVRGVTLTNRGIATRIQFQLRSGRKVAWSSSRRLTPGTMVALSPVTDQFRTVCLLATIAARPLSGLQGSIPEIDIFFTDHQSHEVDGQKEFVLLEPVQGYLEAHRYTMQALQKQSTETFVLSAQICRLDNNVDPPQYLSENPKIDLSPLVTIQPDNRLKAIDAITSFPAELSSCELDRTQLSALRDILTKRLAIVQGPPGTGKTHVSKIAVEILLKNRAQDSPLIIACQTNHALDQLLEKIHPLESEYIRLGGRSVNATVKMRTLYEVKKKTPSEQVTGSCFGRARKLLKIEQAKVREMLKSIDAGKSTPYFTIGELLELDVLSKPQADSIERAAARWTSSDDSQDALQSWVGNNLVPFTGSASQPFVGEDVEDNDLEFDQRKELDAEMGIIDDEDIDMLRGDYVSFTPGFTSPVTGENLSAQIEKLLSKTKDFDKIPDGLRGALYCLLQEKAKAKLKQRLCNASARLAPFLKQYQIGRWEEDAAYLAEAPIIGMTTTGLSKYRPLIAALKPKVVLIEEAAEVMEAPVAVACMESVQHLILVGDHQQLQASCSVKDLEKDPYHLNMSMFERLVNNGMPYQTLLRQRRMMPEFRELFSHIYPGLEDHVSVTTRQIPNFGMGQIHSYFYTHDYLERQDGHLSWLNDHEAEMVAKTYRHLIRNAVPGQAITVLTFYNGQRKLILRKLKDEPETASIYNTVKTVDSYQGEENHIVLLSLVRSNTDGKIGFLAIKNRVTVALSRAKHGFYIFGNQGFLSSADSMWQHVAETMTTKNRTGPAIPTTCVRHEQVIWHRDPTDFDSYQGGCDLLCGGDLPCGHDCLLKCHVFGHDRVLCYLPCSKTLPCGHPCSKDCVSDCQCRHGCKTDSNKQQKFLNEVLPEQQGAMNESARPQMKENTRTAGNGASYASIAIRSKGGNMASGRRA